MIEHRRAVILTTCLLLACSSAAAPNQAMLSYSYPSGPEPYDRALSTMIMEELGSPDLWRMAGSAPFGVINGNEPQTYQGFVVETVLKNERIDAACQGSSGRQIIAWRPLAERAGVEVISTWEPMAATGHAAFPLGRDSTCALRRQSARAWVRSIVDVSYSPLFYQPRSGSVSVQNTGLDRAKPCAEPLSGMWKWGNGTTCVTLTFNVAMTALMATRPDSTLPQPQIKTVQFKAQLPGIRLEIDCFTQTYLQLFCPTVH